MTIFVFDGPEKAGKTTLIKEFAKQLSNPTIRRWGPVTPDDRVYTPALREDLTGIRPPAIWDRSWVSEYVYAALLGRNRRLRHDPWLGEWLHGRAVYTDGLGIIVTADVETLTQRRDSFDLPVDPSMEKRMFEGYAQRFDWLIVNPTRDGISKSINQILTKQWLTQFSLHSFDMPAYAGPPEASVLFIGDARNARSTFPGAWLPFSSITTTRFARVFRDDALRWGWTNSNEVTLEMLAGKRVVVAVGKHAARSVPSTFSGTVLKIAHPAYAYRFLQTVEYENDLTTLHHNILKEIQNV